MAYCSKTFCDFHIDEDAEAACLKHKTMLCFQCISDRACGKSERCIIKDINKFTKDDTNFQCIVIRQELERKEKLINEYGSKILKIKNDLTKEIIDEYENVIKRVNQMKENTITSLEEQAAMLTSGYKQIKDDLLKFKSHVFQVIDQPANEEEINSCEYSEKIKQLMKKLKENHPDTFDIIKGEFKKDKNVNAITAGLNDKLGEVYLYEEGVYFDPWEIRYETTGNNCQKEETVSQAQSKYFHNISTNDIRINEALKEEIEDRIPEYLSSEENNDDYTLPPDPPQRRSTYTLKNTSDNEELLKQKEHLEKPIQKKGEKARLLKSLFSGKPEK